MDLQVISKRSKCCMLLDKTKITFEITGVCTEDVLMKNLETIESQKIEGIQTFPGNIQIEILQDEETLQYVLELMKPDISVNRVKQILEQIPLKDLMKYAPEEVRAVLSCQEIEDNYMGIYLKCYQEDGLSDEELLDLWEGLEWFRENRKNLTDDWLESIGAGRSLFMEPVITRNFICEIQDYDSCIQMLVQRKDVRQLINALCQADNGETVLDDIAMEELCANTERISGLWSWVQEFFEEQQLGKFLKLWLQNHALVYDLECLKKKAESGERIDKDSILMGRASYIAFFYNEKFPVELEREQEDLIIYAITHKKRAFLNLIRENIQLYKDLSGNSVLFCRTFYDRCLNVNSMNSKNLAACEDMANRDNIAWDLLAEREHTFEELALIYALPERYIQLYESFSARRTDERLRVMREIVKKRCLPVDVMLGELSENLMQKPLSQWMQQDFGHIQDLSHENAVRLLSRLEMLARFIPDMRNNAEVRYVWTNLTQCQEAASMEELRENSLECNGEWKYLAKAFVFSEEFIAENRERIIQFILEDGAHIMKIYCESQPDKRDDLRRLVSAELMGRFKELKYYRDDLSHEIDYPVTECQKKIWMENSREEQGELAVWEEDGLLPVMQMGVKPHVTCLSYIDGMYNQCLLACHDANKKVLYLSYRGKVVLRAAIRLTKGAYNDVAGNKQPRIHFADLMVDETESRAGNEEKAQEYLTLFLERAYLAELPERLKYNAYQLMMRLMKSKAKEMDALLTVSESYQESLGDELIPFYYFMYISKSKAGEQYLDSLGGNNRVDAECSYKRGKFLMDSKSA